MCDHHIPKVPLVMGLLGILWSGRGLCVLLGPILLRRVTTSPIILGPAACWDCVEYDGELEELALAAVL